MSRNRPPWARKLQVWLADTQYAILQDRIGDARLKLDAVVRAAETRIENGQEHLETAGLWALCLYFGHEPIPDQCNKPEHDFCGRCQKPMPNSAHGPQY